MRSITIPGAVLLLASILSAVPAGMASAAPQKKEYLSEAEADKIREAGATGPRIVLFASFASDRIKKLQYEFAHFDPTDQKRTERLNSLINGYTGCIDDAADLIEIGIEKQQDIREGVKAMQAGIKEFLPYLQGLAMNGPERETYKENLEDAIEATQDAAKDVEKAVEGDGRAAGAAQTVVKGSASLRKDHRASLALPGGDRIFQRIFTRLGCQGRPPQFQVELYPYANLSHTLRLRQDVAYVRLSDILHEAPVPVIEAAAAILLGQMYRRRVPRELRDLYRQFALAHSTRRHIARVRRKRARRIPGQSARLGARSGAHVRCAQRGILRGTPSPPSPGMERAALALAVWMLRSFARSDCDEQAAGPCRRAFLCGGIYSLSRNAAREASVARCCVRAAGALP